MGSAEFQPLCVFRPLRRLTTTPEDPCMCCNYPGTNIYQQPVGEGIQTHTTECSSRKGCWAWWGGRAEMCRKPLLKLNTLWIRPQAV